MGTFQQQSADCLNMLSTLSNNSLDVDGFGLADARDNQFTVNLINDCVFNQLKPTEA